MIKLTFCGGADTVTGANYLLEAENGLKMLVDCGLEQGSKFANSSNREPFSFDPSGIKFLFITHAHIDHIGRVPKLVKDGFNGVIFSIPETRSLAHLLLEDAWSIMDADASREGVLPIYDKKDIEKAMSLWQEIQYHSPKDLGDGWSVYIKDAGHILGSSIIEFTKINPDARVGARKIVFTGDLGNSPSPLLKDTEDVKDANYLIMESVYGDRNHEPREEARKKFKKVIKQTISEKGVLLIPAFSLERTQNLLYEINNFVENREIENIPVFLDSPLAIKITEIYKNSFKNFNERVQKQILGGDDIFRFPKLKFTLLGQDSQRIHSTPNPKIVIAGSGMSTGGRILEHEREYLDGSKNTILFVGYQAPGSLGRVIADGAKEVEVWGQKIKVRAKVESIEGYSSHKDSEHLIEFVSKSAQTLQKVFVVMGEPKSKLFLVQRLRDYLNVDAVSPEKGESMEIDL